MLLNQDQRVYIFFHLCPTLLYLAFKFLWCQVGILGNTADFYEKGHNSSALDNLDRRVMMIAFDMRYGVEKVN